MKKFRFSTGFTLIELLVVIAILGILAGSVLVALDPLEQLARGRDAGRKSSISQLGKALQSYYTVNQAYPVLAGWNTSLTTSGEIKIFPAAISGALANPCTGGNLVNGYCYQLNGGSTDFVVYTHLESKAEKNKGTCGGTAANTWYAFSSADGKGGTLCQVAEPAAGTSYGANLL